MKHNGQPFEGECPGTAEQHMVKHLRLHEKLFLALLFGWAACGPLACAHEQPAPIGHDVAACLAPCAGASAVITAEVPEKGTMCRCWAPNAFSYTFSYPVTAEDFAYAKQRWDKGLKAAEQCRRKGLGWEPDQSRDNVVCAHPASYGAERAKALQRLQDELDESLQRTRAEFERTHNPPHTSLGRLHPDDWPRYLPRPACTQWVIRKRPA